MVISYVHGAWNVSCEVVVKVLLFISPDIHIPINAIVEIMDVVKKLENPMSILSR